MATKQEQSEGTALALKVEKAAKALGIPIGIVDVGRSGDQVMDEIIAEIASAGSVDEALKSGTVHSISEYEGQVLAFTDFHYQPSDYDPDGWPYVVIKAGTADGEPVTVTTGARQVVVLLALARKTNGLPFLARVVMVPFETSDGERRSVVKLEAAS
jgi:hypothetical protein